LDRKTEVYAKELCIVGKKFYYMEVVYTMLDGTEVVVPQFKSKGIPKGAIENYCATNNITVKQLFIDLYEGKEVQIPMIYDKFQACFQYGKNFMVSNRQPYSRKIKFPDKNEHKQKSNTNINATEEDQSETTQDCQISI